MVNLRYKRVDLDEVAAQSEAWTVEQEESVIHELRLLRQLPYYQDVYDERGDTVCVVCGAVWRERGPTKHRDSCPVKALEALEANET